MSKKYMRSVGFYDTAQKHDLRPDEAYCWSYLSLNVNFTLVGLYSISRRLICFETGISRDRLDQILNRLAEKELITYDAELMFVPLIPEEQNHTGKKLWEKTLLSVYDRYCSIRSDMGTPKNKAFEAFERYHEETLYQARELKRAQSGLPPSEAEHFNNDASEDGSSSLDQAINQAIGGTSDHVTNATNSQRNGSQSLPIIANGSQSLPIKDNHLQRNGTVDVDVGSIEVEDLREPND